MELHFDELPSQELEVILHQRCSLPLSYAKKLVAIMLDLQVSLPLTRLFVKTQIVHFVILAKSAFFSWGESEEQVPKKDC